VNPSQSTDVCTRDAWESRCAVVRTCCVGGGVTGEGQKSRNDVSLGDKPLKIVDKESGPFGNVTDVLWPRSNNSFNINQCRLNSSSRDKMCNIYLWLDGT
jgi:hypothetical protein